MFMTESRRKFSRQKETTKEISSHRTYSHLASTSIPRESLKEGENVESSVPAPFIVGFYRPDNSLMAYKGQRSKQLSQSIQNGSSPLRSDSYMKESSTSTDRMIHNNVNSYSTRHLHAIKPSGPSKFRTCSRTTEDINKDVHSTIQHSPGPVLSQALKLEKFRTPDFGNVHSVTRTHAWVEQQTISEKSNEHGLKNMVSGNTNIKMEYNKVNTISKQPEINRKIPHQLHENLDRNHPNTLRHHRIEKQNLCAHFSPKRGDDNVESESLRNACAKWFARDDVTSIHRHIPNKQGTYVDLSLNIKSSEEPDKVVQKETIGRTHQETSKRRHLDEDEDKSSSESGRGTMQSGMTGPKHHLDISLDSDHSVVTWIKKESIPCNQTSQLDAVPHDSTQSSSMKPKTVSSPQDSSNSERKDRQKSQPVRNRCQTGLKSTITRNSHQNKIFLNDTESNTTTSIDLESLTLEDDDDDVSGSNYHEDNEMFVIRQQLDGLETMYSEILRLLGVKSRCLKMGNRISRPEHHHRSGRSRKIYGSLSSLTGKSCSTHREKSHCHNEKRRCKESKNGSSNRCIQRLECHVVNLARNIARLSSEIRSQQYLSRELDELRNDVTWVRDQLKLVQSSTSKNFKDWDTFRTEVLQILNPGRIRKLTKFFGAEPPLLRQFLKRLGYEKYAPNFETEKIGIMELPYLNEEKLQKLGIPMGPRIRILQEAHFTFHQNDLKIYIV